MLLDAYFKKNVVATLWWIIKENNYLSHCIIALVRTFWLQMLIPKLNTQREFIVCLDVLITVVKLFFPPYFKHTFETNPNSDSI